MSAYLVACSDSPLRTDDNMTIEITPQQTHSYLFFRDSLLNNQIEPYNAISTISGDFIITNYIYRRYPLYIKSDFPDTTWVYRTELSSNSSEICRLIGDTLFTPSASHPFDWIFHTEDLREEI